MSNQVVNIWNEYQSNQEFLALEKIEDRYGQPKFGESITDIGWLHNPLDFDALQDLINKHPNAIERLIHYTHLYPPTTTRWILSQATHVNSTDQLGRTPLHEAARYNDLWLVNTLLQFGGDCTKRDLQRLCPVAEAAYHGHATIVSHLLHHMGKKSTVAGSHTGNIALAIAAKNGNLGCLKVLLKARFGQINSHSPKGNTPLSLAISEGHADCVKLLLAEGADPDLANFNGETARQISESCFRKRHIRSLLYNH